MLGTIPKEVAELLEYLIPCQYPLENFVSDLTHGI